MREIANEREAQLAEQGYVRFNSVSRVASVLSQMFRHLREYHGYQINLKDMVIRVPETEISFDYKLNCNVLVGADYIEGWIHALGEICADNKIKHVGQHVVYAEAVQALVDGLSGDKDKALAFIGGIELAKEYAR